MKRLMVRLLNRLGYLSFSLLKLVKSLWIREYTDFRLILEQSDEIHYFYIKSSTQRLAARIFLCSCIAIIFTISSLSIYSIVSTWRYDELASSKLDAEKKRKEAFEALKALSDEPQNFSEETSQSRLIDMAHKYKDDLNKMHKLVSFSKLEFARANKTLEAGLKASGMSFKEIEKVKKSVSKTLLASIDGVNDIPSTNASKDLTNNILQNKALISFISSFPAKPPVSYAIKTSKFGPRIHPITGRFVVHEGLDYVPTIDLNARSVNSGTVESVKLYDHGYGKTVTVLHTNGIRTSYSHLALVLVNPGQKIIEGTPVGKIGNTGLSTGTHLHFEIMNNKTKINPSIIMAMSKNVQ